MFKKTLACAAVLVAAFLPQAVAASTFTLQADGQWASFDVDNTVSASGGLEWIDLADNSALTFQFTLTQPGLLKVVDGGFAGDVFQVSNNGVALGSTSAATNSYPSSVGLNFDSAWADNAYSQAVFQLAPGDYSITGILSGSALDDTGTPINATVGAVSLTAVPIPAAWGLFLAGSGLVGAFARRRAN